MKGRKPNICVPVVATTSTKLVHDIKELQVLDFQIIEIRIDYYEDIDDLKKMQDLLDTIDSINHKEILFTYRSKIEGGNILLEDTYLKEMIAVISKHPSITYVDVEFNCGIRDELIDIIQSNNKQVILSNHNFKSTPPLLEIETLLKDMATTKANIVKVAFMPLNKEDVLYLMQATLSAKQYKKPIISMSMGPIGAISRLVGEFTENYLTFAMHEESSAPGQINIDNVNKALEIIHQAMKTN